MRSPTPSLRILALGAIVLLACACGGKDDHAGADSEVQGAEGFFNPREGETWKYRVQREIPLEIELAEDDLARRPQRTDSGHLVTFDRVRICRGARTVDPLARTLTSMDIVESGTLLGQELYDIGPKGVLFRGWLPVDGDPASSLLAEGVKLATPGLQAGQSWTSAGADPNRHFLFRVIEITTIKVPAGSFEAARIQILSDYQGNGLKRTIWFAPNIGIVREESVYYDPQRTIARETSVLVHYVVPTSETRPEPAVTAVPEEGDSAPPRSDAPPVEIQATPDPDPAHDSDPAPSHDPAGTRPEPDGEEAGGTDPESDPGPEPEPETGIETKTKTETAPPVENADDQ